MKIIKYSQYKEEYDMELFYGAYSPIRETLEKIYGEEHLDFEPLQEILKLGNPKDKYILDLGCGSKTNLEDTSTRRYEPWLARALYEFGANIIGIDLGGLESEKFTGYKIDLQKENSLSFLQNNSIDIAITSSFLNSPSVNGEETLKKLLPQLERIVKPEGYFIFDRYTHGY